MGCFKYGELILKEVRKEERSMQRYIYKLMAKKKINRYYGQDGAYMYDVTEFNEWVHMHKKHGHCQRRNKDE